MSLKRLFLAAATALLIAAPAGQGMAQSKPAALKLGVDVDAGTLDPRTARDTTAYRAVNLIYDGLVQLSPDLKPVPNLAVSWENPDPLTYIFKLRDGVKFQDGTPLTAEDVVFTFSTILDPKLASVSRALYTPIAKIESLDAKTVKFTLSAPYSPLLSYLDMGIVSKKATEAGDIGQKPVGTGPMKLGNWAKGSKITLVANDEFWGGKIPVTQLDLVVIGDNTARAQALEAGDLDFIQSPLSPQDIKRLAGNAKFGNAVTSWLGVTDLNFNTPDPRIAGPAMRRALAMLVDQTTIVDKIYEGVDKVATSVLMPTSWAYTDKVKQPGFNVEGAKKALADLGWKDTNGDGILDKGGQKLTITLSTHSEDPSRVQSVEYMQTVFKQAGIDVQLRITDWPSFSTNYVQKSMHQVALLGWLNIVDPDRLTFGQLSTGGSTNWGKYSNPKLDEPLQKGRTALKIEDRKAAYEAAAAVVAQDLPYYIVSYQGYQMFYNKALGDLPVDARGNFRNLFVGK
ncbi:ABC transporter substrate-binding protein [soil metagenome]